MQRESDDLSGDLASELESLRLTLCREYDIPQLLLRHEACLRKMFSQIGLTGKVFSFLIPALFANLLPTTRFITWI